MRKESAKEAGRKRRKNILEIIYDPTGHDKVDAIIRIFKQEESFCKLDSYFEEQAQLGRFEAFKVGLLRVVDQELLVGLFTIDVPRQLGGRNAVPGDAGDVDPILHVVPGLAPHNVGSRVREVCNNNNNKMHCHLLRRGSSQNWAPN